MCRQPETNGAGHSFICERTRREISYASLDQRRRLAGIRHRRLSSLQPILLFFISTFPPACRRAGHSQASCLSSRFAALGGHEFQQVQQLELKLRNRPRRQSHQPQRDSCLRPLPPGGSASSSIQHPPYTNSSIATPVERFAL